jgi:hypothetical protein
VCFSAEADLIAGVVVGGVGVDALRHVRHRREATLAALPVVFGAHQMIEAFTWWGLDNRVPVALGEAATWVYLVIAFILPVLVPVAVLSLEPDSRRRRALAPFVALGCAVTVILLVALWSGPVAAEIAGRTIAYHLDLGYGGEITALYVVATCGPLLLSRVRRIRVFGVLNLAAVTVLAWLMATRVISLWCAWAAVTSIVIVIHLRTAERHDRSVPATLPV